MGIGQDGANRKFVLVVPEEGDNVLVRRVLRGVVHKVDVGIEDAVTLLEVVLGKTTPELSAWNGNCIEVSLHYLTLMHVDTYSGQFW